MFGRQLSVIAQRIVGCCAACFDQETVQKEISHNFLQIQTLKSKSLKLTDINMCSQSKREILKMGTESFHVDHHHTCRVFKHILKGFSSLLFEPRKQPIDPCVLPRESSPQRFPRSFSLVFLLKPADLGCEKSLFIYFLIRC